MRYVSPLFRPPAEASSFILQATLGCSWNRCAFCSMYRQKAYHVRPLQDVLEDIAEGGRLYGSSVRHVFVADGDPLAMETSHWEAILAALGDTFPNLRRVGTYASAQNVLEKTEEELVRLAKAGLMLLYVGPESGDDPTLTALGKGSTAEMHAAAARRARAAGMELSLMFLLGAGGVARSREHARASAQLATVMDPKYLSLLTLTVVPGSPLELRKKLGQFELPDIQGLLRELLTFVAETQPRNAIFRADHASNHLPIAGRLPRDRARILALIQASLRGEVPLRPGRLRGL